MAKILIMHFVYNITIGDIESWLREHGLNYGHSTVVGWFRKASQIIKPLDEPLRGAITASGNVHSDETTLKCQDKRLSQLYKCYDTGELIVRIACLVHMRRPLFKLKDYSRDADELTGILDSIFRIDRDIKCSYNDFESIRIQRILCIVPLFNDLKSRLDTLLENLDPKKEPELFKAVTYALKEYPCMLRCLESGELDLSNNVCERQIRRITKYRNNSFFVGSPEAGEDFARLQSLFANIKNHALNAMEYICDLFRRIKQTAAEEMENLLAHKWQPTNLVAE